MGMLPLLQAPVAVAGGGIGDGVKGGGIEGNHAQEGDGHDDFGSRQGAHDVQDQLIKIPAGRVGGDEIGGAGGLEPQGIIAEHDKADDGGTHAEEISSQNHLLHGAAAGNIPDEEGSGNAPDDPVGPVIDGPVLGEAAGARGIGEGRQLNEMLGHFPEALEAVLNDEPALAADEQHDEQQSEEKPDAGLGQKADAPEAVENRIGIDGAGDQQDDDGDRGAAEGDAEEMNQDGRHEGGGDAEGGGGAGQQGEEGEEVDDPAQETVRPAADDGTAGLRVPLAAAAADMEHEAEGDSQHQIEGPGNEAPVKERKNPGPVRDGAQLRQVGTGGVHDPFGEGIEEDIRGETAGEHHAAPGKEGIAGLFMRLAQDDGSAGGQRHDQGNDQDAQAEDQIIGAQGVAKEEAYLGDDPVGLLRQREEQAGQGQNQAEGSQGNQPVNAAFGLHRRICLCHDGSTSRYDQVSSCRGWAAI